MMINIKETYMTPWMTLAHLAHETHRENFDANQIQLSTLCNIKSGGCPEDCSYCGQSARHEKKPEKTDLMPVEEVLKHARSAKENGATRFCMGAAWRNPHNRHMPHLIEMIKGVKALGLETCATLGMLTEDQAKTLKEEGLDYYNHNIDTSRDYYPNVITTRSFDDRLKTLKHARTSGLKLCCGGILGLGESRKDRIDMIGSLHAMAPAPESIPINTLVPIKNTPLAEQKGVDDFELLRTIATVRITCPTSYIRLSAGRNRMSESLQTWCFYVGANSIFYGDKLLTTNNQNQNQDKALMDKLGLQQECLEYS